MNKKVALHASQYEIATDTHRFRILNCGRRWGKALELSTEIPMYGGGFKALADISLGDTVIDELGQSTKVTGIQDFQDRPCHRVTFSDGSEVVADENHEWLVWDKLTRKAHARSKNPTHQPRIVETKEMVDTLVYKDYEMNYSVKNTEPVQYPQRELPIHPYVLGFWLGDGHSYSGQITVSDSQIAEFIASLGHDIRKLTGKYAYSIHGIVGILRDLDVLQNKHIPDAYLYSSIEQRTWLLKGLMDSDGTVDKGGRCQFDGIDKRLVHQVQLLLHTLGQKTVLCTKDATLHGKKISDCYRINFTPTTEVFNLSRKSCRQRLSKGLLAQRSMRYVIAVERVKNRDTRCLEVDSPSHLFLVTDRFIPTHNSVVARMIVLQWAVKDKGLYWIVSPTYKQSKQIHWRDILNEIPQEWVKSTNKVDLSIELQNGSLIELKGVENFDNLRGVKLSGLVVDEVASIRNWNEVWQEVLRPTLTDKKAPAVFISTPKGYNHFYELYEKHKTDEEYASFTYTSYDNPIIPKEEIDKARQELDEDAFAQEYMAEFRRFTGLVFKDFNRQKHVVEPIELMPSFTYYRGIDFGFANPTGVVFVAIDHDSKIYVYDEIYMAGLQTPDLAQLIKQKSGHKMFSNTIADSAQQSDIKELNTYGIGVYPVSKTSGTSDVDFTTHKIRKLTEKIRNGEFYVFNNCENFIKEIEDYQYHEVNYMGHTKEVPMKVHDHLLDAMMYIVVSMPEWTKSSPMTEDIYEKALNELPNEVLFTKGGFY